MFLRPNFASRPLIGHLITFIAVAETRSFRRAAELVGRSQPAVTAQINQLETLLFWEMMRREKGSTRPPLTEAQRRQKPPVSHPVFLAHPITGKRVLYANPGYTMRINALPARESDEILEFLFAHQLQDKYVHEHQWTEGDVLMWDNIGTLHNAIADYGPHQHRLMRRCQVMADWIFAHPVAGPA